MNRANGKPKPSIHGTKRKRTAAAIDAKPVARNSSEKVTQVKEEPEEIPSMSKSTKVLRDPKAEPRDSLPSIPHAVIEGAAAATELNVTPIIEEPEENPVVKESRTTSKKCVKGSNTGPRQCLPTNLFEFIVELFNVSANRDESSDLEGYIRFKEMLLQLAETIHFSTGAHGMSEFMKAVKNRANSELVSILWICVNVDLGTTVTDIDGAGPIKPEGEYAAGESPPKKELRKTLTSPTELISSGTKLMDKNMSQMGADAAAPTVHGLFAATRRGLIFLDLQTLEAKPLTIKRAVAVAVNHNLNKVYWAEDDRNNSCIIRSNFDGSAQEIIVPRAEAAINVLTIDEASGNIYFAQYSTHEITVCNALGQNRAVFISSSSLVNQLDSIAVDSENGFMYWNNCPPTRLIPSSIVRANLHDGSKATTILAEFKYLTSITRGQPSNEVLYWANVHKDCSIGTIDLNGSSKRVLVKLKGLLGLKGVQVDTHKIYFINHMIGIQSVDRDSGKDFTTIFRLFDIISDLALCSASVKQP